MSIKVTINTGKKSFTVNTGETILEAALRQDHHFPYNCRNGICGSCKGRLIEGKVHYQNDIEGLSVEEINENYILFCQAVPTTDLLVDIKELDYSKDIIARRLPCRVKEIRRFNDHTIILLLKLPSNEHLQFLAGQYIDLLLRNGKRRSFSLANAPHQDNHLELHIRYYKNGIFSEYTFYQLQKGALLKFEGPLGSFFFREDSERPMIMVAGGTGFAPIKSIIEHSIHCGNRRTIYLYRGARNQQELYLNELAQSWADDYSHIKYIPVLSEESDPDWQGKQGLVHQAMGDSMEDISQYEVYTCGPPPMIQGLKDLLIARGLPEEFIYSDAFESAIT